MAVLPAEVAMARAKAALAADEADAFARVTAPTLWIQAGKDHLLRAGHVDDVRASRPDAQVEIIEGPHTILQRRPRECLAGIERLLRGSATR